MDKASFKIGDKVRVLDPKWKHGDGIIVEIGNGVGWVRVEYDVSVCVLCDDAEICSYPETSKWHKIVRVEHVVKKGQQLVFDFMKGD